LKSWATALAPSQAEVAATLIPNKPVWTVLKAIYHNMDSTYRPSYSERGHAVLIEIPHHRIMYHSLLLLPLLDASAAAVFCSSRVNATDRSPLYRRRESYNQSFGTIWDHLSEMPIALCIAEFVWQVACIKLKKNNNNNDNNNDNDDNDNANNDNDNDDTDDNDGM
jgi:hypothetical protein